MSDPRRALIVIDVQNEYVTGRLRVEYPEVHGSLARIGRAMDAAHATGIPIAVIQHHAMGAGASLFARGSAGWGLHETVSRRPYDVRVEKTQPSALAGTGLGAWLRARAIDTLTVAGYMTHNCDDATIRHAVHSGFAVEFLADAAGAVSYSMPGPLDSVRLIWFCRGFMPVSVPDSNPDVQYRLMGKGQR